MNEHPEIRIAGYCRVSVDIEADRDNTSIEHQKAIIEDYVNKYFPGAELTFYIDRDRSGYTFDQRESYREMRPLLMNKHYNILVVKDLSRFSRRNSRGLVELEDLRDAGLRIIAIGDSIDYPTHDDWTNIRLRFLLNEMPVTDSSQKVRAVIDRRQNDGHWICSVPYGYVMLNTKAMTFTVDPPAAAVVRKVFQLYSDGWGYKKIANYLTAEKIPTPRLHEKARYEAMGLPYKVKSKPEWSGVSISGILQNDFYIGTLRQGKYSRCGINGKDKLAEPDKHIVFENHHEAIVDPAVFQYVQEQLKQRTKVSYRGVSKYHNPYSGRIFCGDCGDRMFSMSRPDLASAYICGRYMRNGTKGCSSHHTRMDLLDDMLKRYILLIKNNSTSILKTLDDMLRKEADSDKTGSTIESLEKQAEKLKTNLKILTRQRIAEIARNPDQAEIINETYDELTKEEIAKLEGLQAQIDMLLEEEHSASKVKKFAKTALEVFDVILDKDRLDKKDIEFMVDSITVYEKRIDIRLKADLDNLLCVRTDKTTPATPGTTLRYSPPPHSSVEHRTVDVVREGDPPLTTSASTTIGDMLICLAGVVELCEIYNSLP